MRPLALFTLMTLLVGCATGGKAPGPPNYFYDKGARALASGDRLATKGCNQNAVKSYFKAVELFTLADEQAALASCFNNIGNLYLGEGKSADALAYYREAAAIHTRSGNHKGLVRVWTNMAAAQLAAGAPAKADERLSQAEALAAETQAAWPPITLGRANLRLHRGDTQGALDLLLALDDRLKNPDAPVAAALHFALGRSYFALGRHGEALTAFSKALAVDRGRGALRLMARDLQEMGRTLAAMGRNDEAIWHLERALGITTLLGAAPEEKTLQDLLIDVAGNAEAPFFSVPGYFRDRWAHGESLAAPCD